MKEDAETGHGTGKSGSVGAGTSPTAAPAAAASSEGAEGKSREAAAGGGGGRHEKSRTKIDWGSIMTTAGAPSPSDAEDEAYLSPLEVRTKYQY